MANILLILIFFIFSSSVFASDTSVALKDLPVPTPENLRWNMPADGWRFHEGYVFKGKAFRISEKVNGQKFRGNAHGVKMYDNLSLEGQYYIVGQGQILDKLYGQNICSHAFEKSNDYNLDKVVICKSTCNRLTSEERNKILENSKPLPVSGLVFYEQILTRKTFVGCPISLNGFFNFYSSNGPEDESLFIVLPELSSSNGEVFTNYYFSTRNPNFDKGYIEIEANNKKFYLDVRVCKERPEHCKFVDIQESLYEKDWISLKKHQEKKDIPILDILIKELKPCVIKKDLACIKKYFPDPVKHEYLDEWYHGYHFPKVTLDEEFLKELETCLDYKQLLPHLMGTRGINKVCKFMNRGNSSLGDDPGKDQEKRRHTFIIGVDYPESVRISNTSDEIYFRGE